MDANEWLAIEKLPGGARGLIDELRAELDAARARIAELEADLLKLEGFRADLAELLFAQEGELAALRAVAEAIRPGAQPAGETEGRA